ncbi:putative tRNA (adenine(37)-N6)-methyltransferase, partial [Haemophilus influenzae]
GYA